MSAFTDTYSMMSESEIEREKKKWLNMSTEEKKKYNKQQSFDPVDKIPRWAEYGKEKKEILTEALKSATENFPDLKRSAFSGKLNEKVSLWIGDIRDLDIDAIVNAANNTLLGGGGVDGAIHRSAGPALKSECATLKGCETGEAKITGGYQLPAKYIIHTVGPRGTKPNRETLLKSCYENCMKVLMDNNLRTIAFPCISTGIYGYPLDEAAIIACDTIRGILEKRSDEIDRVIFCVFAPEDEKVYQEIMQLFFPLNE